MNGSKKIDVTGGAELAQNPFSRLVGSGLPETRNSGDKANRSPTETGSNRRLEKEEQGKNRGRVDILRVTAGRGGKTVTIAQGFVGIGLSEKEALAKKMQKRCGCGGTVKDGRIEIQGDKRDDVAKILEEAGFRAVFAGG